MASCVRRWFVGLVLAADLALATGGVDAWFAPPARPTARVDWSGNPLPTGAITRMCSIGLRPAGGCGMVGFSRQGKEIFAVGPEGAYLWDAKTGKVVRRIQGRTYAFSRAGHILIESRDELTLWDICAGRELSRFEKPALAEEDEVYGLSPDGKFLVVVQKDMAIVAYETSTGKVNYTLRGHETRIQAITFSTKGNILASAEADLFPPDNGKVHAIYLWDLRSGRKPRVLRDHNIGFFNVAFSPDDKTLAATGGFRQVRLWDTATGNSLPPLGHPTDGYKRAAFSPDGKTVATTEGNRTVLWDLATRREVRMVGEPLPTGRGLNKPSGPSYFTPLIFSPDGQTLASSRGGSEKSIVLWDVATGKEAPITPGHQKAVLVAIPSPDGKRVATASEDGTIRLWNAATGRQLRQFGDGKHPACWLAFTPDGKTLLSAEKEISRTAMRYIRLWNANTGREQEVLPTVSMPIRSLALSLDGKTLAVGTAAGVFFWDLPRRKKLRLLEDKEKDADRLAISPDGKLLAVGTLVNAGTRRLPLNPAEQPGIRLWDLTSGKLEGTLPHHDPLLTALAFAPGGRILAARSAQGAHLWDVAAKRRLRIIKTRQGFSLLPLHFSPDGKLLALGNNEGPRVHTIGLYETATGTPAAELSGHSNGILWIAFTTQAPFAVTGGGDCTALLWDLQSLEKQAKAEIQPVKNDLVRMWESLGESNARTAYRSICRLVQFPRQTVEMFRKRLKPFPAQDARRIRRLIQELDSDALADRQRASRELEELTPLANMQLQEALRNPRSAEVRRRVLALLDGAKQDADDPERLREVRVIQALERIGSPDACALLRDLAKEDAASPRARDAQEALDRLERRSKSR